MSDSVDEFDLWMSRLVQQATDDGSSSSTAATTSALPSATTTNDINNRNQNQNVRDDAAAGTTTSGVKESDSDEDDDALAALRRGAKTSSSAATNKTSSASSSAAVAAATTTTTTSSSASSMFLQNQNRKFFSDAQATITIQDELHLAFRAHNALSEENKLERLRRWKHMLIQYALNKNSSSSSSMKKKGAVEEINLQQLFLQPQNLPGASSSSSSSAAHPLDDLFDVTSIATYAELFQEAWTLETDSLLLRRARAVLTTEMVNLVEIERDEGRVRRNAATTSSSTTTATTTEKTEIRTSTTQNLFHSSSSSENQQQQQQNQILSDLHNAHERQFFSHLPLPKTLLFTPCSQRASECLSIIHQDRFASPQHWLILLSEIRGLPLPKVRHVWQYAIKTFPSTTWLVSEYLKLEIQAEAQLHDHLKLSSANSSESNVSQDDWLPLMTSRVRILDCFEAHLRVCVGSAALHALFLNYVTEQVGNLDHFSEEILSKTCLYSVGRSYDAYELWLECLKRRQGLLKKEQVEFTRKLFRDLLVTPMENLSDAEKRYLEQFESQVSRGGGGAGGEQMRLPPNLHRAYRTACDEYKERKPFWNVAVMRQRFSFSSFCSSNNNSFDDSIEKSSSSSSENMISDREIFHSLPRLLPKDPAAVCHISRSDEFSSSSSVSSSASSSSTSNLSTNQNNNNNNNFKSIADNFAVGNRLLEYHSAWDGLIDIETTGGITGVTSGSANIENLSLSDKTRKARRISFLWEQRCRCDPFTCASHWLMWAKSRQQLFEEKSRMMMEKMTAEMRRSEIEDVLNIYLEAVNRFPDNVVLMNSFAEALTDFGDIATANSILFQLTQYNLPQAKYLALLEQEIKLVSQMILSSSSSASSNKNSSNNNNQNSQQQQQQQLRAQHRKLCSEKINAMTQLLRKRNAQSFCQVFDAKEILSCRNNSSISVKNQNQNQNEDEQQEENENPLFKPIDSLHAQQVSRISTSSKYQQQQILDSSSFSNNNSSFGTSPIAVVQFLVPLSWRFCDRPKNLDWCFSSSGENANNMFVPVSAASYFSSNNNSNNTQNLLLMKPKSSTSNSNISAMMFNNLNNNIPITRQLTESCSFSIFQLLSNVKDAIAFSCTTWMRWLLRAKNTRHWNTSVLASSEASVFSSSSSSSSGQQTSTTAATTASTIDTALLHMRSVAKYALMNCAISRHSLFLHAWVQLESSCGSPESARDAVKTICKSWQQNIQSAMIAAGKELKKHLDNIIISINKNSSNCYNLQLALVQISDVISQVRALAKRNVGGSSSSQNKNSSSSSFFITDCGADTLFYESLHSLDLLQSVCSCSAVASQTQSKNKNQQQQQPTPFILAENSAKKTFSDLLKAEIIQPCLEFLEKSFSSSSSCNDNNQLVLLEKEQKAANAVKNAILSFINETNPSISFASTCGVASDLISALSSAQGEENVNNNKKFLTPLHIIQQTCPPLFQIAVECNSLLKASERVLKVSTTTTTTTENKKSQSQSQSLLNKLQTFSQAAQCSIGARSSTVFTDTEELPVKTLLTSGRINRGETNYDLLEELDELNIQQHWQQNEKRKRNNLLAQADVFIHENNNNLNIGSTSSSAISTSSSSNSNTENASTIPDFNYFARQIQSDASSLSSIVADQVSSSATFQQAPGGQKSAQQPSRILLASHSSRLSQNQLQQQQNQRQIQAQHQTTNTRMMMRTRNNQPSSPSQNNNRSQNSNYIPRNRHHQNNRRQRHQYNTTLALPSSRNTYLPDFKNRFASTDLYQAQIIDRHRKTHVWSWETMQSIIKANKAKIASVAHATLNAEYKPGGGPKGGLKLAAQEAIEHARRAIVAAAFPLFSRVSISRKLNEVDDADNDAIDCEISFQNERIKPPACLMEDGSLKNSISENGNLMFAKLVEKKRKELLEATTTATTENEKSQKKKSSATKTTTRDSAEGEEKADEEIVEEDQDEDEEDEFENDFEEVDVDADFVSPIQYDPHSCRYSSSALLRLLHSLPSEHGLGYDPVQVKEAAEANFKKSLSKKKNNNQNQNQNDENFEEEQSSEEEDDDDEQNQSIFATTTTTTTNQQQQNKNSQNYNNKKENQILYPSTRFVLAMLLETG